VLNENPTADVWIQFNDGIQLVVAADCASVDFTDPQGCTTHYPINSSIPPLVRDKLVYISSFLDLMKQNGSSG